MLFHMDRRRKQDGGGDHQQHSMDYHRRRDAEAEAVLEDLLKEHQGGKVLGDTMGLVQNGAKRLVSKICESNVVELVDS